MSIHLVVGRQGSGKTLFLCRVAEQEAMKGRKIYSNFKLKKIKYTPIKFEDIINCKYSDGVVLLDEIHLILPSRNSLSKTSRLICDGFLSMVRKKGLDVYGTTQTPRKVDVRFREEADFYYICKKYGLNKGRYEEIIHAENLSKKIPVIIKMEVLETFSGNSLEYIFLGNPYYNFFDTREIIRVI